MLKAIKRLRPPQVSACVVDVFAYGRHSEVKRASLSVVGSSSGISSSQRSIICGKTAACLCPVSTDKQQPDYNHLSHTDLPRSQGSMTDLYVHVLSVLKLPEALLRQRGWGFNCRIGNWSLNCFACRCVCLWAPPTCLPVYCSLLIFCLIMYSFWMSLSSAVIKYHREIHWDLCNGAFMFIQILYVHQRALRSVPKHALLDSGHTWPVYWWMKNNTDLCITLQC